MDSLFVFWSGHGKQSLNSGWIGLKAICGDHIAHEGCFANKELHLVDI